MSTIAHLFREIKAHQTELFIVAVVLLVGTLGFGLGRWSSLASRRTPVRIENISTNTELSDIRYRSAKNQTAAGESEGKFVASKNGAKYYPAGCASANRIKPENLVSFATAAAAEQAGYTRTTTCP